MYLVTKSNFEPYFSILRFRQHKQEVMQTLLKAEYRRSQKAQRQRMLENLSDDMKEAVAVSLYPILHSF